MARAYVHLLSQDSKIAGKTYNVGGENLSLDQIAQNVRSMVNEEIVIEHQNTDDLRSYRVDSSKIAMELGFTPEYSIQNAILDLKKAFEKHEFVDSLQNSNYFNIKKMKELSLA
jgi:nucleoside-diphosphate-sugar epimerase